MDNLNDPTLDYPQQDETSQEGLKNVKLGFQTEEIIKEDNLKIEDPQKEQLILKACEEIKAENEQAEGMQEVAENIQEKASPELVQQGQDNILMLLNSEQPVGDEYDGENEKLDDDYNEQCYSIPMPNNMSKMKIVIRRQTQEKRKMNWYSKRI